MKEGRYAEFPVFFFFFFFFFPSSLVRYSHLWLSLVWDHGCHTVRSRRPCRLWSSSALFLTTWISLFFLLLLLLPSFQSLFSPCLSSPQRASAVEGIPSCFLERESGEDTPKNLGDHHHERVMKLKWRCAKENRCQTAATAHPARVCVIL